MSTDASVDKDLVEKTRQQIRGLMSEIARLSKEELEPEQYYAEFLNRLVTALAATGGAVWTLRPEGGLDLAYQINLQNTGLAEDQQAQVRHGRLLHETLLAGEAKTVGPQSGGAGENEAANPTNFLLVLCPLKSHKETMGLVEVFQRPNAAPATQQGYLRFLSQACDLAGEYLKTRSLRDLSDRQTLWTRLENFTRAVHTTLDPRETCYTIANEGRRLIECDRVSVCIARGRKCKVEAISGQDQFDKRSNLVAELNHLATVVTRAREEIWYSGSTENMAPQIESAIHDYADESQSKMIAVLPLYRPREDEEDEDEDSRDDTPLGALVVEQIEDTALGQGYERRVDVVRDHCSSALANALDHNSLFLMPLWRRLGRMGFILKARTLPKTVTVAVILLIAILCLFLVPGDFALEGRGALRPVRNQDIFAEIDGVISDVFVEHDEDVQPFEYPEDPKSPGRLLSDAELTEEQKKLRDERTLLMLRNVDLEVRIASVRGQFQSKTKELIASQISLQNDKSLTQAQRDQLFGRREQLEEEIRSLTEQIVLLREQWKRLRVFSPIEGKITTLDVRDRLIHRPVERGQLLLSVADADEKNIADWELEVRMPEDRMAHILRALNRLRTETKDPQAQLPVTFILANDPGVEHKGKVTEIHLRAEVHEEEGNTVMMKIKIAEDEEIEHLRSGAGVVAQVHCGTRSIGYVWFHDLWEFIQSRIIFRFF